MYWQGFPYGYCGSHDYIPDDSFSVRPTHRRTLQSRHHDHLFLSWRVHRWDTLCYFASQFAGALVGVFVAHQILGQRLAADPVCYVRTIPGEYGTFIAFIAEFTLSGLLMAVVLCY
jgi:hypothetical protein